MPKFPVDAPINRVVAALERLGFNKVREGNHISMLRENPGRGNHRKRTADDREVWMVTMMGGKDVNTALERADSMV